MADNYADDTPQKGDGSTEKERIHADALKRFERASAYWSQIRSAAIEDMKFLMGDSDNQWQWPDWAASERKRQRRPMLTVNKLPQHTSQVTNEIRQNPPQSKVRPVDDGADVETAKVFTGIIRHIWSNSDATFAICNAAEWQVGGGYGYFRIRTDYPYDDAMEQEIFVEPIADPTTVYDDPAIVQPTGCDRKFLFIVEDMPRAEFREEYPKAKEVDFTASGGNPWWNEETVRVAEYFCCKTESKTLNLYADGSKSDKPHPFGLPVIKSRKVSRKVIKWYKISGAEILEERDILGKWIPVVRVVGREKIIESERTVKGMVRNAKDPARMYNFWATAYAERVALVPKSPYIGPKGFAEGLEDRWKNANVENVAFLEYNPVYGENGEMLPPPTRQPAPEVPAGFVEGLMLASDDIKSTTGQYDASLGQRSNETSGRAIMARQREGDVGTFDFIDNLSKGVEFASRIILDIAPKVYDTARIARMLGEDGSEDFARIDPEQREPMAEVRDLTGKIQRIYNLGVGRYDVVASTGPTYTTKRAEAADFFTQLAQSDPSLMQKAGDIIVKNFDMPGAEELADRLKLFLPPEVANAEKEGEGEQLPPQIKAAVQQIEQANQMLDAKAQELQQMQQQIESEKGAVDGKKQELQNIADRIAAEMRELELRKQVAIRDIKLAEANLRNAETQAKAGIDEYVQSVTGAAMNEDAEYGSA